MSNVWMEDSPSSSSRVARIWSFVLRIYYIDVCIFFSKATTWPHLLRSYLPAWTGEFKKKCKRCYGNGFHVTHLSGDTLRRDMSAFMRLRFPLPRAASESYHFLKFTAENCHWSAAWQMLRAPLLTAPSTASVNSKSNYHSRAKWYTFVFCKSASMAPGAFLQKDLLTCASAALWFRT